MPKSRKWLSAPIRKNWTEVDHLQSTKIICSGLYAIKHSVWTAWWWGTGEKVRRNGTSKSIFKFYCFRRGLSFHKIWVTIAFANISTKAEYNWLSKINHYKVIIWTTGKREEWDMLAQIFSEDVIWHDNCSAPTRCEETHVRNGEARKEKCKQWFIFDSSNVWLSSFCALWFSFL